MADNGSSSFTCLSFAERYQADLEIIYQKYEHNFDDGCIESEDILLSTLLQEGSCEPWLEDFVDSQLDKERIVCLSDNDEYEDDDDVDDGWESDSSGPSTAKETEISDVESHNTKESYVQQSPHRIDGEASSNLVKPLSSTRVNTDTALDAPRMDLSLSTVKYQAAGPFHGLDDVKDSNNYQESLAAEKTLSSFPPEIKHGNLITSTQLETSSKAFIRPSVSEAVYFDQKPSKSSLNQVLVAKSRNPSDNPVSQLASPQQLYSPNEASSNLVQAILNSRNRIASVLLKAVSNVQQGNSFLNGGNQNSVAVDTISSLQSSAFSASLFLPDKLLRGFSSLLSAEMMPASSIPRYVPLRRSTSASHGNVYPGSSSQCVRCKNSKRLSTSNTCHRNGKVTLLASRKTVKLHPRIAATRLIITSDATHQTPLSQEPEVEISPRRRSVSLINDMKAVSSSPNELCVDAGDTKRVRLSPPHPPPSKQNTRNVCGEISKEVLQTKSRSLTGMRDWVRQLEQRSGFTEHRSNRNNDVISSREKDSRVPTVYQVGLDTGRYGGQINIERSVPITNCLPVSNRELLRHTEVKSGVRNVPGEGDETSRKRRLSEAKISSETRITTKKMCRESLMRKTNQIPSSRATNVKGFDDWGILQPVESSETRKIVTHRYQEDRRSMQRVSPRNAINTCEATLRKHHGEKRVHGALERSNSEEVEYLTSRKCKDLNAQGQRLPPRSHFKMQGRLDQLFEKREEAINSQGTIPGMVSVLPRSDHKKQKNSKMERLSECYKEEEKYKGERTGKKYWRSPTVQPDGNVRDGGDSSSVTEEICTLRLKYGSHQNYPREKEKSASYQKHHKRRSAGSGSVREEGEFGSDAYNMRTVTVPAEEGSGDICERHVLYDDCTRTSRTETYKRVSPVEMKERSREIRHVEEMKDRMCKKRNTYQEHVQTPTELEGINLHREILRDKKRRMSSRDLDIKSTTTTPICELENFEAECSVEGRSSPARGRGRTTRLRYEVDSVEVENGGSRLSRKPVLQHRSIPCTSKVPSLDLRGTKSKASEIIRTVDRNTRRNFRPASRPWRNSLESSEDSEAPYMSSKPGKPRHRDKRKTHSPGNSHEQVSWKDWELGREVQMEVNTAEDLTTDSSVCSGKCSKQFCLECGSFPWLESGC